MKVDGLSLSSFIVLICLFIVKYEVNIVKYEIEFMKCWLIIVLVIILIVRCSFFPSEMPILKIK